MNANALSVEGASGKLASKLDYSRTCVAKPFSGRLLSPGLKKTERSVRWSEQQPLQDAKPSPLEGSASLHEEVLKSTSRLHH